MASETFSGQSVIVESGNLISGKVASGSLSFPYNLSILNKIAANRALAPAVVDFGRADKSWCSAPWELPEITC